MAAPVRAILSDTVTLVKTGDGPLAFQATIFLPEVSDEDFNHLLKCVNTRSSSLLVTFQEGIPDPEPEEVLKDD